MTWKEKHSHDTAVKSATLDIIKWNCPGQVFPCQWKGGGGPPPFKRRSVLTLHDSGPQGYGQPGSFLTQVFQF